MGCATAIVLALLAGIILLRVTFSRYRQTAHSMEPAVVTGDALLVRPAQQIERGDLIVFLPPGEESVYLKRVIALPNEQVEMRGGLAIVDGLALNEPYVWLSEGARPTIPVVRDHSNDSRFLGFVTRQQIRGRVVLVISTRNGVWRP